MKKPLLLVNTLLILGMLSETFFLLPLSLPVIVFLSSFFLLLFCLVFKKRRLPVLFCMPMIWAVGALLLHPYNAPVFGSNHVVNFCNRSDIAIEGVLYKPPVEVSGRTRLYVEAENIYTAQQRLTAEGRIRLTIGSAETSFRYGDRIRFPARLRLPENFSNPGGFDFVRYLAYQRIFTTAFMPDDGSVVLISRNNGNAFIGFIERYRDRVRASIENNIEGYPQHVMKALILGEKASLPGDVREHFRKLGISHLLAISGLHVGIVSFLSYFIFMWAMKLYPRVFLYVEGFRAAVFLSLFPMLFYCMTAGFHMPTIRAACMVGAYTAALLIGRKSGALNNLLLACFIMLVVMPTAVFHVSFQLSFAAVLSIILVVPALQSRFNLFSAEDTPLWLRLRNALITGFFASSAAIIGTAPVIAFHFHKISILGFLTNIVAVPFVGFLIVPSGLAAAFLLPVSDAVASVLFKLSGGLTDVFLRAAEKCSKIPFGDISVTTPQLWEIGLYFLLFFSLPLAIKNRKVKLFFAGLLLFVVIEGAFLYNHSRGTGELRVTFIDVGRGDAALAVLPEGSVMLIDAGGSVYDGFDYGMRVVAPVLYKKRIKRIDYMVATHPHIDHFGGLVTLVENFSVGQLWINCDRQDVWQYRKLLDSAENRAVEIVVCSQETEPMEIDGVRVTFFNPEQSSECFSENHVAINNRSIVFKLEYGYVSYLFTGDIEAETEFRLVDEKQDIRATVLKVPHHGSLSSSTKGFINAVLPEIAVISGRPRGERAQKTVKEVADDYILAGAEVYKTYTDGAVTVTTDGTVLDVQTHGGRFYRVPRSGGQQ